MVKALAAAAVVALYGLLRGLVKNRKLLQAAAVLLPGAAALVCAGWEPLCLIPILSLEWWLDLPGQLKKQRPREAECRVGLVYTENLTSGDPQVEAVCAPFQLEGVQRRRGGDILFNTAMALCAQPGSGLVEYAAQQGFDRQRLTDRMPLLACRQEGSLNFATHQDRGAERTFVMGDLLPLLSRCKWVLDGRERLMTDDEAAWLKEAEKQMLEAGLKVQAFALQGQGGCTYLGMAGTALPIHQEACGQIAQLKKLGAKPILLGRGSREELWALACKTGIINPGQQLLDQSQILEMDDARLAEWLPAISVFCNLDMASRRRVVNAWAQQGEKVLPLGPEGLETWIKALEKGRRLDKTVKKLLKNAPLMTFAPCLLTLVGAGLNSWPLCAASVAVSAGWWLCQKMTLRG